MELSRALQHNIVGSGADIKEVISNVETEIPKTNVKVGYQGIKGANGHEATIRLFPDAEAHCYKSFGDVLTQLIKEKLHSAYFLLKTQTQARFLPYMT